MKILLSLPPNLVSSFHDITGRNEDSFFCTSDPVGHRIGSGGGSTWLLKECHRHEMQDSAFGQWLAKEKRILIHAGGESRRLPGYSTSGKILTPIPVFRWAKGQKIGQDLLSLQLPLYQKIMDKSPDNIHTLIASGDVFIRTDEALQDIPDADVICYGVWVDPSLAKNHGIFAANRQSPEQLDFMLQKPTIEHLGELIKTHLYMMDIGVWLLSDKAVEMLARHSYNSEHQIINYDLYSQFGRALGNNPEIIDDELKQLKVAILPLPGGEFYHYGTSRELLSSTLAVQNLVNDQNKIFHHKVKPHPAIFVQNAITEIALSADNSEVWIENSFIGKTWTISNKNIITGVPKNEWTLNLRPEICLDIVPIAEDSYLARPYGFNDPLGEKFHYNKTAVTEKKDLFKTANFPVCQDIDTLGKVIRYMIEDENYTEGRILYERCDKISGEEILNQANLKRLFAQRLFFQRDNLPLMARNHEKSVFYNLNLDDIAAIYSKNAIPLPSPLPENQDTVARIANQSLRARILQYQGHDFQREENQSFRLLQEGLTSSSYKTPLHPHCDVYSDQIVWSRSPVRIDLAGGWTDTPPYCLTEGGNVVNISIELNGQQPIQVYVKPSKELNIVLRSIDLGASEKLLTFNDIRDFKKVGSPFSIPKAALALSGFVPEFCDTKYESLEEQLRDFGCGMEITLLSAIPAGSGLGTSSVLSATVLAALSDFCHLGLDKIAICNKTLILEQLLTTGGGWQDQFGGVIHGVKLLQTKNGFDQTPTVKWLPEYLFKDPEYQGCHLLYYTGITRTAKNILSEIVRNMFLNETDHLALLAEMKNHALNMYDTIQKNDFQAYGMMIAKTWSQNKALDSGTNPAEVEAILKKIDDYCYGYKLPGAGGGGYIYMVAKDVEAGMLIKKTLTQNPPNDKARFVEMRLSEKGLQTTRS